MRRVIGIAIIATLGVGVGLGAQTAGRGGAKGALPVVVFDTAKGSFEVEFYPTEAPKSVEHILALVRRNFYNGLRVHRFVEGFVVQFGDPQTRDMTKKANWGSGGSGRTIGAAEISPKRPHKLGAVALAYASRGGPTSADSQLYVCTGRRGTQQSKVITP
jgi:cyclophilin family peptidyl-prolyl cis-trans isomerase